MGLMPRHQARGERRVAQLLDAAAEVFAESGYEATTTNAIAARAGASPGTLYQFFPNKEAIADALAERYLRQLGEIFAPDISQLPAPALADHLVDPLMAFSIANPGFTALFVGPAAPGKLAPSAEYVFKAVLNQVGELLESFAPQIPGAQRARSAQVAVQVIKGILPLVLATSGAERTAMIGELKRLMAAYLGSLPRETA
jgi:AcrR family transcriptional regulator